MKKQAQYVSAEDLRKSGFKKKSFRFPIDGAKKLEHRSVEEDRAETEILLEALEAYLDRAK